MSAWVARVAGDRLGPVNDGDDRADARTLPQFATGWRRTMVSWPPPFVSGREDGLAWTAHQAMALTKGRAVVLELDDYGRPIHVRSNLAHVVERIERDWPNVHDLSKLARAPLALRYWLLERLAAEGDPPDEAFAILPWDLLDRAVRSVIAMLDNDESELVEIRHWLTPAVRGLTGPLEQLDHGLRTRDTAVARLGASGLLDSLRHMPLSRVPEESLAGLLPLVDRLGKLDLLYRHTARVVRARLVGDERNARRLRVTLNSALDAAANHEDGREHTEQVADEVFRVRFDETEAGWVRVLVQITESRGGEPFGEPGGVFAPLRVVPRDGAAERRYWVPLHPEGRGLVGAIAFALPGGWSEVDCAAPPVTADDLASVRAEDLLPSLDASTPATARQWLDLADDLPRHHPVRVAAERFEEAM